MNIELNRLATFSNWPGNAPVEAARIAKGGFFATGNDTEVQCHWCSNKITDWRYGDQVMVRHRRLDALCPFVVDPNASGNVPIITKAQPEIAPVDLMNEQCRLATFKNWPSPYVTPQALAKAGFYYYNQEDRVSCAWCHGVIAKWEEGDNPFTEHEKFFPNCPRVELGPNIELAGNGIRDIGIQQIRTPKREKYSSLDARLRTFTRWPRNDIQPADVLATAGFYYLEIDDQVRCFHCNGGLRSWQKEDDPWFEHAKWFPKCQFVELVKGSQYVAEVQSQVQPSLEEAMASDPVLKALQMGFDEGRVRMATKKHLESTGRAYASVDGLVDAVLEEQYQQVAEYDEDENSESSSNIVRQVSRILDTIFNPRPSSSSSNQAFMFEETDEPIQDIEHNHRTTAELSNECHRNNVAGGGADSVQQPTVPVQPPPPPPVPLPVPPQVVVEGGATDHSSLEEENRKLKDARLCKVCMADEVGVVFLPCGHLVTCVQCATGVSACPLCRTSIKAYVRTFLS